MNGVPGTLLEQGIVGLLKCVKILVILQSRWWLVVRIPSILLFLNPPRLLLFLSIDLLQKFMGREKKTEGKKLKTTQVNCNIGPVCSRLTVSAPPPPPVLSPLPKVFLFLFLSKQIRKDAVSEVLVRQPWHIAIHSSLM